MDDGDAVGADDLAQRFAHRLDERGLGLLLAAVEGRADQVGEHLGVRLGLENMAFLFELSPKRKIVFDDAVVHEAPGAGLGQNADERSRWLRRRGSPSAYD